jgi:hypothetical protein
MWQVQHPAIETGRTPPVREGERIDYSTHMSDLTFCWCKADINDGNLVRMNRNFSGKPFSMSTVTPHSQLVFVSKISANSINCLHFL